jgi:hypothetical protein
MLIIVGSTRSAKVEPVPAATSRSRRSLFQAQLFDLESIASAGSEIHALLRGQESLADMPVSDLFDNCVRHVEQRIVHRLRPFFRPRT